MLEQRKSASILQLRRCLESEQFHLSHLRNTRCFQIAVDIECFYISFVDTSLFVICIYA